MAVEQQLNPNNVHSAWPGRLVLGWSIALLTSFPPQLEVHDAEELHHIQSIYVESAETL
jgi:hypothetical protein